VKKFLPMIVIIGIGVVAGVLLLVFQPERDNKLPEPGNPLQTEPLPLGVTPTAGPQMVELKGPKPGLRVLFVGNSHTFTNNLPDLVAKLAKDEERPLLAWSEAPGGTSFQMHWENGRVQKLLADVKWDLVVLQDQSVMPNLPRDEFETETIPAARKLSRAIKDSQARPVLFMTWGYESDFFSMQKRSRDRYQQLADDLKADLVPVGSAWEKAMQSRPNLGLWSDGNHATMKGSYLAACVFYAVFYGKSPVGNSFSAGLDAADSRFLQETAASVVRLQPGGLSKPGVP
jgi:hypothetical protein